MVEEVQKEKTKIEELHTRAEDYVLEVPEDLKELNHINLTTLPLNLRQEFCFEYASLPERFRNLSSEQQPLFG